MLIEILLQNRIIQSNIFKTLHRRNAIKKFFFPKLRTGIFLILRIYKFFLFTIDGIAGKLHKVTRHNSNVNMGY